MDFRLLVGTAVVIVGGFCAAIFINQLRRDRAGPARRDSGGPSQA